MDSIWSKTCRVKKREALHENLSAEAVVIGAGMAGVLTAHVLKEQGAEVVVVERGSIGGGQTQNTAAKITAQHGMIYTKLIHTVGEKKARMYAQANLEAIEKYRTLIHKHGIDCDFEQQCAYVYGNDEKQLQKEVQSAKQLGLNADFVRETSLPIQTAGAVRFDMQAQFHPMKFIGCVADNLKIYENTPALTVHGNTVQTPHGSVTAKHVIFACHFPFINFPGAYFAKMHQERSYILALEQAASLDGMWISAQKGGYSFRRWNNMLLLGGENHRAGENRSGGCYERLREKARQWFPQSREVAFWSAQDCITPDGIPYIGKYSKARPDWYIATGFQKWGMSTSMVAAQMLGDMVCGKVNPYAPVFDPARFEAESIMPLAVEGAKAAKGITKRFLHIPAEVADAIPAGHGGIVLFKGKKTGVYKDENGKIYPVDVRCPHLGCQLEWNPDELSWDCPCHGSRFDRFGRLLTGPAQENISI